MEIQLNGVSLQLLPSKAVWWSSQRTLLVADVHLGKDQVFRRHGIAIPGSVLATELDQLSALIAQFPAERLLVLGDWVHAAPREPEDWPDQVRQWRAQHATLPIELIPGNHDRQLEPWLAQWDMKSLGDDTTIEGLRLCHATDAKQAVVEPGMSGHWHPSVRLRAGREAIRLAAFARRDQHLILPSFGRFTGGMEGLEDYGWRLLAAAGQRVVAVG
ncbi:MAG: ligase-associated DNA damage response endonuclease PdeM [Pseudomonadota bacterium]